MRYVGMDVHKKVIEIVIIGPSGERFEGDRIACERAVIQKWCEQRLRPDDRIALEATTNTWGMVDLLSPFVQEVVVSNPLRTKAIAEAKVKTDKVDAMVLAQLLRCDYLPTVWTPDPPTRNLRSLTSRRAALVSDRTRLKNRIHAVLHQRIIHPPVERLFSKTGRQFLTELQEQLDDVGRDILASDLRLLEAVEQEIDTLDATLKQLAYRQDQVKLLMTMPGVDVAVAQTLVATLGDVTRFRDGDHAASYLGLVPSTKQSAFKTYHGAITKQGRAHARWMMVQAAQHLGRHPGPLGVFFRRKKHQKNHNVAVVATARKLVVIAWLMLSRNEPYRYALPRSTESKLQKLRVAATGKRRRRGSLKGSKRSETYGTGRRTRYIPSLDEVYAKESLPPVPKASPGETRMMREAGVEEIVEQLNRSQRILRNKVHEATAS